MSDFLSKAKEESKEPIINAKAIEIAQKLNDVIKYGGSSSVVYDIKDTSFTYLSNFNTTFLAITSNLEPRGFVEGITEKYYYREVCKIENQQLIGCTLQGLTLENLSHQCKVYNSQDLAMNNNIYYCPTERVYTVLNIAGQKYLVSVYPSPKINVPGNSKFCNAYWVDYRGKRVVLFICDFWIKNDECYFPRFIGSFVARPQEGSNKKVTIYFYNISRAPNLYPFCKKSFYYNIMLRTS